jgi:molybdopterin synthase sulfur carrier subunit
VEKTITLLAQLRMLAGEKTIRLTVDDGATVRDLLRALADAYPALAARVLDVDGTLRPEMHLVIEGRHLGLLPDGLDTPIADAREMMLVPPIAGG